MLGRSSTSAASHRGTGVGTYEARWAHYQAPLNTDPRTVHTQYDFASADTAIRNAVAASGSVTVQATRWSKTGITYTCNNRGARNRACTARYDQTTIRTASRSGCVTTAGRHDFRPTPTWTNPATTAVLYYDKAGDPIQVSYHMI